MLEEYGIILVVNLWTKVDPEVSSDQFRNYLHMPMHGNKLPNPDVLDSVMGLMKSHIKQNAAVLIHCEAGVNRSCFLTACLVAEVMSCSGQDALTYVDEKCGRVKIHKTLRQYVLDVYR